MNTLLWILQVLAALMYAASGVMKIFMFDRSFRVALAVGAHRSGRDRSRD